MKTILLFLTFHFLPFWCLWCQLTDWSCVFYVRCLYTKFVQHKVHVSGPVRSCPAMAFCIVFSLFCLLLTRGCDSFDRCGHWCMCESVGPNGEMSWRFFFGFVGHLMAVVNFSYYILYLKNLLFSEFIFSKFECSRKLAFIIKIRSYLKHQIVLKKFILIFFLHFQ